MAKPLTVRVGDDPEMDDWLALTDEQQDAELATAERQYNEFIDSMSLLEQYRYFRRSAVVGASQARRLMTDHPFMAKVMREQLKRRQIGMVKLRHWHRTGVYPPDA